MLRRGERQHLQLADIVHEKASRVVWILDTGYLMLRLSTFAEAGAGLLPLALSAPQLPVLHSINFSAFLGVAPGPPQRRLG